MTPVATAPRFTEEDRGFETPCHIWTGATDKDGYAILRVGGKLWPVHRLLWTVLVHAVPPEGDVHHRCEVKSCVRLDHLEELGHADHTRRHKFGAKGNRGKFGPGR